MRILKLGNPPEKRSGYYPIEFTCPTCESVLEVVRGDIKYTPGPNSVGIVCPVCGDFTKFDIPTILGS